MVFYLIFVTFFLFLYNLPFTSNYKLVGIIGKMEEKRKNIKVKVIQMILKNGVTKNGQ